MIKRIRDFFCNTNPIGLAAGFVMGLFYLAMMIDMGVKWFLLTMLIASVFCALLFAVIWIVYKAITYAQSHCS